MLAILHLLGTFVASLFKSQHRLELENLFLRHQLNIALRRAPHLRLREPFPGGSLGTINAAQDVLRPLRRGQLAQQFFQPYLALEVNG
jgi:hypothetical protein